MAAPNDRLLLLTDGRNVRYPLVEQVRRAVDGGVRSVVLREKHRDWSQRVALAEQLVAVLTAVDGRLIVADPDGPVPAAHLSADAPMPVPRPEFVGRSAHRDDPRPVDVDYVTYSPMYLTTSKPGYGPALGAAELRRYCAASPVPVYALGGITRPWQVTECRRAGAHGVAVMGALMRADDPATVAAELIAAAQE